MTLYIFTGRRGKKKGGGLLIAAGAAMAAMMAQAFMGKVALIAGKALVIAKVALAISAIIGLKKLFGSGGGGGESHQVVYATGGHEHGGWQGRAFTSDHLQAHDIAYKAQKPENTGDE
jgi:CO/xanthine dehydrogenase Mo-binding subunit